MNNTIILLKGETRMEPRYYKNFEKGNTIFGLNSEPEELKRWSINDKEEAQKELSKYKCSYKKGRELYYIEEYALEYCDCNEDGEVISGSDYDLAEEEVCE